MNTSADSRRLVYALLVTLALGMALGRLLATERLYEPSLTRPDGVSAADVPLSAWPRSRPAPWPTFSSNDRSRWAAVRTLVEQGTFVVGTRDAGVVRASGPAVFAAADPLQAAVLLQAGYASRVASDRGVIFEDGFQSVDKVLHPERLEFYSTKPPLLTVLAAGQYWLLNRGLGWTMAEDRWKVIPLIVLTFNVLPFLLSLVLLARLAEEWGTTDWGRYYVVAAGGFGTLVTPFLVSFNNHIPATAAAILAVYAVVRVAGGGGPASWVSMTGWYALAGLGAGLGASLELPALALAAGLGVYLLARSPARALGVFLPVALVPAAVMLAANYAQLGQLGMAYAEFGGPWYQYEGSHWRPVPGVVRRGIDFAGARETKAAYAFHLLLGHHGLFSLTPVMLLAAWGAVGGARRLAADWRAPAGPRPADLLGGFTLLLSLVVIGFYIVKTDNYGGWSNGPRWLMWLTPLWLLALLPVADRLDTLGKPARALGLVLLAASVLSMSYQLWNPWRHPWLYVALEARGWIRY